LKQEKEQGTGGKMMKRTKPMQNQQWQKV